MGKIPTELTRAQSLRYSRHLMLPAMDFHGQEALLAARVLQIGVGGWVVLPRLIWWPVVWVR